MEFNTKNVLVKQSASSWQEAIDKVGGILEEQGKITHDYTESMKKAVVDLGPYMVLMPGFALVHAAPSAAVKETSISLLTLTDPVNFNSHNDPVYVLMCLACVDKTSHIETLSKMAEKLMQPGIIEELKNCETAEAAVTCLNRA